MTPRKERERFSLANVGAKWMAFVQSGWSKGACLVATDDGQRAEDLGQSLENLFSTT